MREAIDDEGKKYYEYMLLYTDDCLAIRQHPKEQLMEIHKYIPLKPKLIGPPKIYFGAKISKGASTKTKLGIVEEGSYTNDN